MAADRTDGCEVAGVPAPLVAVKDLTVRYPGSPVLALERVSFTMRPGELVGVLGSNGAGKTTLCRVLNGIVPQLVEATVDGIVTVAGTDAVRTPVRRMAALVGSVLDEPAAQLSQGTVGEEVALGLESMGVPHPAMVERVHEVLHQLGLTLLADRAPRTLSGGEQQRLVIAGAIATNPPLLVLDEATAGLDARGRSQVFAVLAELAAAGTAVLVVEHDVELLAEVAGRLLVLHEGRLVSSGTPTSVLGDRASLAAAGIRAPDVTEVASALGVTAPLPVNVAEAARRLRGIGRADRAVSPTARGPGEGRAAASVSTAPTRTAAPVVDVSHASYRYPGGELAVDDVSLSVRPGDVIGVAGANGAGKSTLGRLLDGLLRPTSGMVTVAGRDTRATAVHELARTVGLVFQHPRAQLFARTVADELAFGPRNLGLPPDAVAARTARAAARLGIEGLLTASPFSLPPSARRLVAIASVLAMEPKVLVLDEPTTGADHRTGDRIAGLVASLAGDGMGIVCISHDMRLLARVATSMIAMARGRVVAAGSTRDILGDASAMDAAGLVPPQPVRLAQALGGLANGPLPLTVADLTAALLTPAPGMALERGAG